MGVSRRTFMRLAAAGLASAALPLTSCVTGSVARSSHHRPTPDAPFTPTDDWYFVIQAAGYEADLRNYRLQVGGLVERPMTLSLSELTGRFPSVVRPMTLCCVGDRPNGGLLSASWFRGIPMVHVLEAAGLSSRATVTGITALDGFLAARSLEELRDPDTLLIYEMGTDPENTAPLPIDHGFPLRILTPGLYGYVQPKWISAINFVDDASTFEVMRHSAGLAAGRRQLRSGFSRPSTDITLPAGPQEILGYAFGDSRPVGRVELRIDDGPWLGTEIVWNDAEDELPTSVWVLWRFPWDPDPGTYRLTVRATYEDGEVQQEGRVFPYSGGSLASIEVRIDEAAQGVSP